MKCLRNVDDDRLAFVLFYKRFKAAVSENFTELWLKILIPLKAANQSQISTRLCT